MYSAVPETVKSTTSAWDTTRVRIYQDDTQIGEYYRNYPAFFNTFVPFKQRINGEVKEYALFSDSYTRTAVMELPSCEVVAEEPNTSFGFCPVDFYVPYEEPWSVKSNGIDLDFEGIPGTFGFVAGCHWGDDSSMKVQYFDLSNIANGVIERSDPFGYLELPDNVSLKDAVNMEYYERGWDNIANEPDRDERVDIAGVKRFDLEEVLE